MTIVIVIEGKSQRRKVFMRKKNSDALTPTEWKVMKIMWELESASAREVHDVAGAMYAWAPTTVKTILSHLVDKGFLETETRGSMYIYSPAKPAIDIYTRAADEFIEKSTDDVKGQLLCYMANKIELSVDEIDELQSILNRYKKEQ